MKHDHRFAVAGEVTESVRCRLCSANDLDAVIERLAEDLWESRRHGTLDDWPWADAGPMWQQTYRDFATIAVDKLRSRSLD